MKKKDEYSELTYGGLLARIRDGVPLTQHQKDTMTKCGLTVEDFKIQPKEREIIALLNYLRGQQSVSTVDSSLEK